MDQTKTVGKVCLEYSLKCVRHLVTSDYSLWGKCFKEYLIDVTRQHFSMHEWTKSVDTPASTILMTLVILNYYWVNDNNKPKQRKTYKQSERAFGELLLGILLVQLLCCMYVRFSVSTKTKIEELHLYIPYSLSDYPHDCLHCADKEVKMSQTYYFLLTYQFVAEYWVLL